MSQINVVFIVNYAATNPIYYQLKKSGSFWLSKQVSVERVLVCDEEFTLNIFLADLRHSFHLFSMLNILNPTVIIFTFSVVELCSYQAVLSMWLSEPLFLSDRFDFSSFPIILLGSDSELRESEACLRSFKATDDAPLSYNFEKFLDDTNESPIETGILQEDYSIWPAGNTGANWKETKTNEQHTSAKMGEHLARRINAVKYMECSSCKVGLESLFKEVVWTSIRQGEKKIRKFLETDLFRITVIQYRDYVGGRLVRQFVFNERLDVFGECLNEQKYFYPRRPRKWSYSTFIEIDGEAFELEIDLEDTGLLLRRKKASTILFVFSVVDFDSYSAITNKLVQKTLSKRHYEYFGNFYIPPIILVGYEADLRDDAATWNKLSKQGLQPITYEMGEELARKINAVRYLECSCSDTPEINNVFEAAVLSSLRDFEEVRRCQIEKLKPKQGLFKRLLKRIKKS